MPFFGSGRKGAIVASFALLLFALLIASSSYGYAEDWLQSPLLTWVRETVSGSTPPTIQTS